MLIKFESPAVLSKVVDIISDLVTEVRIKITSYGLSITAMDPANVSMVHFSLPKSAFSQFEAREDGETLGVNLDNLKSILKRCNAKSNLIMEKKQDSNLLEIAIEDKIKRNFTLMLIDIDSLEKDIPELEFAAKVNISSVDLVASLEDCNVVSDAVSFIIREGKFILESKSMNSARSEYSGDEAEISAEDTKSRYSLEYLSKFMKGAKLVDKTLLQFGSDHPLRVEFNGEHMQLLFILAPRVENDD